MDKRRKAKPAFSPIRLAIVCAFGIIAYFSGYAHFNPVLVFILCGGAIVFLAKWIGSATEALAHTLGSSVGALLGATFGNSVELIIAIIALHDGLYDVVKASVVGSVLANLLLTLGVCMILGGSRRRVQTFNQRKAGVNSVMLFLAVIGLTITSIFSFMRPVMTGRVESLSIGVAIVFLLVYILGFVFSLFTHRSFLVEVEQPKEHKAGWPVSQAIFVLLVATLLVSFISDELVGVVQQVALQLGLTQMFIGLIFLPLIGITPEFFSAILFARNNQMDGSVEIAVGSSLQIALFVAPTLVIAGKLLARPLTLVFTPVEVVVIFLSTVLVSLVSLDGETHWFEGIMVVATYVIFAMLFFFQ